MLLISKIGEVGQLTVTAHPSNKDHFADPLVQHVSLPGTFFSGASRQLTHACLKCHQEISFTMKRGDFIAGKTWALSDLGNQRELLDQIGQLLNLKLRAPIENGVEITRYYTAVLDIATVGYYRCPRCSSQYLIGYARRVTDNEGRGMPESDTMHVQCIAHVVTDEQVFLAALKQAAPMLP